MKAAQKTGKFRKCVIGVLLGGFALWVIATIWLHLSYCANLPATPDVGGERVVKIVVNHGFGRYATKDEVQRFNTITGAFPIAAGCFLLAVGIGLKYGDMKIAPGRKLNE